MKTPTPKPGILEIPAYVPGRAKAHGVANAIKLSANENALGASPLAEAAYLQCASELHLYPDAQASALRAVISAKFEIETDRIVFGCGSDEIFTLLCQAYLNSGDNIVQPLYGFAAWAIAARTAGGIVKSAAEQDYTVDVDSILATVDDRTRIIFAANPANPTGSCLPFAEIARLYAGIPKDVVVVLDGAYAEYAREFPGYADGLEFARDKSNVVVTRTFSKLHGLAALRIGWAYAPKPIADTLNLIRPPFNTSAPAQAAALAALEDEAFVQRSIAFAEASRKKLSAGLSSLGLDPIPSVTNFVTARFPKDFPVSANEAETGLGMHGLFVRGLANYGMPDCLRISIGGDDILERLLCALNEIIHKA